MANKQLHILSSRSRSPILLFTICLFAFSFLFLLFSLSTRHPSASPYPNTNPNLSLKPETSFVASLEHFLDHKYPRSSSSSPFPTVSEEDVSRFDDQVFSKDSDRFYREPYYPLDLPIRVYVYEMPSKFTHDLLWLFRNTYRDTDNLTSNGSPVHRLIEQVSLHFIIIIRVIFYFFVELILVSVIITCVQHSVDYWLWADLIAPESERLLKSVVRVERQEDADLFYVPFFTTISFFLLEKQQCKALYRVWVMLQCFMISTTCFHYACAFDIHVSLVFITRKMFGFLVISECLLFQTGLYLYVYELSSYVVLCFCQQMLAC